MMAARLAALFIAALVAGPATAEAPKLTISYSAISGDELPLYITADAGYFKQHGLDVQVLNLPAQQGIPALLTGQVQMISIGAADSLAAAAQGVHLKYVVTHAPYFEFQLWARPEHASAAKLKGQKVGAPSTTGTAYLSTVLSLQELGLKPSDVIMTVLGSPPATNAALIAGSIAAMVSLPPTTFSFQQRGFRMLVDLRQKKIPNITTGLVALDTYIATHRDTVQRAVDAFIEGINRQKSDPAIVKQEIRKYLGFNDPAIIDYTYKFYARSVSGSQPMPRPTMLAAAQRLLGERNPKVKAVDLASLIDDSFVKTSLKMGMNR